MHGFNQNFSTVIDLIASLQSTCPMSKLLVDFFSDGNLMRCDELSPANTRFTYFNEPLIHYSAIDYFLLSDTNCLISYEVIDHDANLSDHLPIMCVCSYSVVPSVGLSDSNVKKHSSDITQLRWDHADLLSYYADTGQLLYPVLMNIDEFENSVYCSGDTVTAVAFINNKYSQIINILNDSANKYVPFHKKNFYKFWWNQELDNLKDDSINSAKAWKAVGRPRTGPIFDKYRSSKLAYKQRIRSEQQLETEKYTNDLHDALCQKMGHLFGNVGNPNLKAAVSVVNK
jgi:hypothetical protein